MTRLGVRSQTLYAYVSRGLIERRAADADPRRSEYRAEDVLRLTQKRSRGRRPAAIAASAIAWGEPIIQTSISTVVHGRLIYRGRDAVALAGSATLEDAAALLWEHPKQLDFPPEPATGDPFAALSERIGISRSTVGRPVAKLVDDARAAVAAIAGGVGAGGSGPIHRRLAASWSVGVEGEDVLRRALVLLADHELNPSTFTVRVAAAAGASIAASVLAGLCALSGPRHGGAGAAVAALADEADRTGPHQAVSRWLVAGHGLPGFGHPLYPHGDPRAVALLNQVEVDAGLSKLRDAVVEATDALPNVDFGLLAVTRAFSLPADASFRLFAVARSVGWAAHAIEQSVGGGSIRPRANYVGEFAVGG